MLKIEGLEKVGTMRTPFWWCDIDLFHRTVDEAARQAEKYGIEIHYSIKANSQKRLLSYMREKGIGADCVSGNEVAYALDCGFTPESIVFAGVGKTDEELSVAIRAGIGSFNCESLEELHAIEDVAGSLGKKANVSLRINPDVDARTHRFITTGLEMDKFGIPKRDIDKAIAIIKESRWINFRGLHFHIGSQITDIENVFTNECISANSIVEIVENAGLTVENIDLGGGLGVDYHNPDLHPVPEFGLWFKTISETLSGGGRYKIHVEPGRSLVAQCTSLISKVIFVKEGEGHTFIILDAGMNDLIRPALYQAYHKIENLSGKGRPLRLYDIAGPICESTDIFATQRTLPLTKRGDIIAIRSAGAYGSVMSSRYNMREPAPLVYSDRL